jgi:Ser/Thr protein kinase RdoA (MazF antagonist)
MTKSPKPSNIHIYKPHVTKIAEIARAFGVKTVNIATPERGYRNHNFKLDLGNNHYLNLIQYKRDADILERIRRANVAGEHLALLGLPARAPADQRILRATGQTTTYFSLYNYLPGTTIPWEGYTKRHLKLLGFGLGKLHTALATMPNANPIRHHLATDELHSQIKRMVTYFLDPAAQSAVIHKLHLQIDTDWLTKQSSLVEFAANLPHQQPLHLDFVRSNLVFAPAQASDRLQFDGLALTGIIDFEKAAWGSPQLDVARTLAFLLVDCRYKTPRQVRQHFLHSGYHKRGGGVVITHLLEPLVDFYLFYDLYKFLRHNPYEALRHNQHFRRTVRALLARQIIIPDGTITKSSDGVT